MRRAAAAALLLLWLAACHASSSDTGLLPASLVRLRASVIVLSFDALRADALGLYGASRDVSPHLDRFAAESWVFDNAYSVSSQTPLSFAAAFTGRYPIHGDFRSPYEHWQLPAGPTLATTFAAAGYATAAFLNNPWLRHPTFEVGFGEYHAYAEITDDAVLQDATEWLRRQDAADPVFVWIHLIDPHAPYRAHEGSSHLYEPGYSGPYREDGLGKGTTALAQGDPRELGRLRDLYDGEIHRLDRRFESWRGELRALGRLDSSILVVTADHGEEFMEHGGLQHSRLYEEHLRVPLVLRIPGDAGARRVSERVSHLDLLPTLAALAGLEAPEQVDGRTLTSRVGPDDPLAFLVLSPIYFRGAALRTRDHKLIENCLARSSELFDLRADPGEKRNLSGTDRELAAGLAGELWALLGVRGCADLLPRLAPSTSPPARAPLDERERERLEALGYLPGREPETSP